MRRIRRLIVVVATLTGLIGAAVPALAAGGTLIYLTGSGEPVAAMTFSSPPGGALPNYDPDRDAQPGLVLARTDGGAGENDPSKHQDWVYDASGLTISPTHLVIWTASKDFGAEAKGRFTVYVMDCGTTCSVLRSSTVNVSGSDTWTRVTVAIPVPNHTFGPGHSLVIRVVVDDKSQDEMMFAYGISEYDAHLRLSQPPAEPTTTSTTTTTPATSTTSSTPGNGPDGPPPSPGAGGPPGTLPPNAGGGPLPGGGGPHGTPPSDSGSGATTTTTDSSDAPITSGSTPSASSGTGTIDPGSPTVTPNALEGPAPVVFAAAAHPVVAEVFETPRDLRPAEGLMVAFATVAENVQLYWQAAVGLGSVAAGLLWVGLSGRRDDWSAPNETS